MVLAREVKVLLPYVILSAVGRQPEDSVVCLWPRWVIRHQLRRVPRSACRERGRGGAHAVLLLWASGSLESERGGAVSAEMGSAVSESKLSGE